MLRYSERNTEYKIRMAEITHSFCGEDDEGEGE